MGLSVKQLKKYRSRFAWVFAFSFVVLLLSSLSFKGTMKAMAPPRDGQAPQSAANSNLTTLIPVASLLGSAISMVGMVFTTGIAWRKERREQLEADLDLEKKKLEVEKLRLEIEGKRHGSSSATE